MLEHKNFKWYSCDGLYIEDNEAYDYLSDKLNCYKRVSKRIDSVLIECLKLNVIKDDEFIDINVCETGENLSIIQIELEMLLEDLNLII